LCLKQEKIENDCYMMHVSRYLWILLLMSAMMVCNAQHPVRENSGKSKAFTLPAIPVMLTDSADRYNYLVAHYWDNFDFNDTTLIHKPDITEQAIVNFLYIFRFVDKERAIASVIATLKRAETEILGIMYEYFLEMLEKFLYMPNSVVRNEELYIPVAEYIVNNDNSDVAKKERAKYLLGLMMKNRLGYIATDFRYTLKSGESGTLHKLQAPYTLLVFYDPDCDGCANSIRFMKSAPAILDGLKSKNLQILAFYPDNDYEVWKRHLADIPPDWINSYDKERKVKESEMYDLKGLPAIYLLDENKKVILKNVIAPEVESYFSKI